MEKYCPKCGSEFVLDEIFHRDHFYDRIEETVCRYCECCGKSTWMKLTYKLSEEEILWL